jgi:hypothetical protein
MAIVESSLMLAADALASQFSFNILTGPASAMGEEISLRMDGAFDPPEEIVNTYEIAHRGRKIPKTNMTEGTTKEFTVPVRIDQKWEVYNALKAWKTAVYNPVDGTSAGNDNTNVNGDVAVIAYDHLGNAVKTFKFIDSRLKSIKIESFDNASDDPSRVTLGFIYRKMEES